MNRALNRAEKRRLARENAGKAPKGSLGKVSGVSGASTGKNARRAKPYRTKADPQVLLASLRHAHELYAAGDVEQARLRYHAILQMDKTYPDANNSLGIIEAEAGNHQQAARWFEKAADAEPTRPTFHNNHGLALLELEQNKDALAAFERSLKTDPDFAPAQINQGKAYNRLGRFEEAVPVLQAPVASAPELMTGYEALAEALGETGDMDGAIAILDKALETWPKQLSLLFQKAGLYVTFGQLEAAERIQRDVLADHPESIAAYNGLARVKKFTERDADVEMMEALYRKIPDEHYAKVLDGTAGADDKNPQENTKMSLAMSLAKAFEGIKDYPAAFKYYQEGNRLKRKNYFYSQSDEFQEFDLRRSLFTPDLIQKFTGHGHPDPTMIFIVGMPRSGTTLLEQVFHAHKDVFGAGELMFMPKLMRERFPRMRDFQDALSAGKIDDAFFKELGMAYMKEVRHLEPDAPFITDKMPHNFLNVGFIKLALPQAKIIHSYRNPIDNAFAIFKQIFGNDGHQYAYDLVELGAYHNKYRELMVHWEQIFPEEILENRYEDMVADLETQTRKVLAFCGLDWDPNCLNFHKAERAVRTASVTQVRQPVYKSSVEKWRKYEAQLQPMIKTLNRGLPF